MHCVNASGKDKETGYVIIKPSGADYDKPKPEDMAIDDREGIKI